MLLKFWITFVGLERTQISITTGGLLLFLLSVCLYVVIICHNNCWTTKSWQVRFGTHVGANESTFPYSLGIQSHPELEVFRGKFRILNVPLSCEISFSRSYEEKCKRRAYNLFAMLQSKTNAQHVYRPYHGIMEAKVLVSELAAK